MRAQAEEFQAYLAPDETLLDGIPGAVVDGGYRSTGSIGVTDRRVLFVADGDGFQDVAHGAVSSIRSRPRTTVTHRRAGYAAAGGLGAVLAASTSIGVLAMQSSVVAAALAFALLVVTVAGVATAERVRRGDAAPRPSGWAAPLRRRLDGVEVARPPGSDRPARADLVDGDRDLAVLGLVVVGLTALVGLVALAGSLLVVPLSMGTLAGVAVAGRAYRTLRERDPLDAGRPRERDVSLHLVDGRVVHLRVEGAGEFDRDLSALVRGAAGRGASLELTRP